MQIKCPRCGKPTSLKNNPFRPFCSERCKLIDLGHWISGDYRVFKGEETTDETDRENKEEPIED